MPFGSGTKFPPASTILQIIIYFSTFENSGIILRILKMNFMLTTIMLTAFFLTL